MSPEQTHPAAAMGADIGYTLAAIDATIDQQIIEIAARQIIEAFRELVTDPDRQGDVPGTVRMRYVRTALGQYPRHLSRPLFDAAIRWMNQLDEPPVEITYLDRPTPADIAHAVVTVVDDEIYLSNQLGLIE